MASAATAPAFTNDPFNPAQAPTFVPLQTASKEAAKSGYVPRRVTTIMNYFKDNEDGSPPEPNYAGKPASYNRPVDSHTVQVQDIRGSEEKYSLDTTGFQIFKRESAEKDFLDEEHIKSVYYPEVEQILKEATGATKVYIFDHTIRRQPQDTRERVTDPNNTANQVSLRGPVQRVHIDQSYSAGKSRVAHHLPDEAETLLKGRYQIINLWRPIKTIRKDPLAVAEANSVSDDDLVPIKLIYPNREGETYAVRYSPNHRFFFLDSQTPEEALLIKCFDSKTDGRARRVPHSAFVDQEREEEESRESIEVRALVFTPEDRD